MDSDMILPSKAGRIQMNNFLTSLKGQAHEAP